MNFWVCKRCGRPSASTTFRPDGTPTEKCPCAPDAPTAAWTFNVNKTLTAEELTAALAEERQRYREARRVISADAAAIEEHFANARTLLLRYGLKNVADAIPKALIENQMLSIAQQRHVSIIRALSGVFMQQPEDPLTEVAIEQADNETLKKP